MNDSARSEAESNTKEPPPTIATAEVVPGRPFEPDSPQRRLIGFGILYLLAWPLAVILIFLLISMLLSR